MTCAYISADATAALPEEWFTTGPKASIANLAVSGWLIVAALLRVLQTPRCLSWSCAVDEIG
jgi:hypothetical protein